MTMLDVALTIIGPDWPLPPFPFPSPPFPVPSFPIFV